MLAALRGGHSVFERSPCSVGVGYSAKGNFDLLLIYVVGVVGTAVPFKSLSGFLAASAFTAEEPRVGCSDLSRFDELNDDPMLPVVADVVGVADLRYAGRQPPGIVWCLLRY